MRAAKFYKKWPAWVIILLAMTVTTCCSMVTKPMVNGGNPPIIEFDGRRAQLYVMGPYTLEQLRQEYKITEGNNTLSPEQQKELERIRGNRNYNVWQLDPRSLSRVFGVSVTYGVVPDGFRQVYPANGKSPEPLIEGKIYAAVAPSDDTADVKSEYFMIENGKAVVVPLSKIAGR